MPGTGFEWRGVTPIGAVSRAPTGVKMQWDRSNGQAVSGVLGPISSIARWPRGMVKILCMCNWSVVNGSRAKTRAVVKAIFFYSQ